MLQIGETKPLQYVFCGENRVISVFGISVARRAFSCSHLQELIVNKFTFTSYFKKNFFEIFIVLLCYLNWTVSLGILCEALIGPATHLQAELEPPLHLELCGNTSTVFPINFVSF